MNALKINKPIAVVDCNFIQRCRGEEDDVPWSWDCLLISSVFGELAIKADQERTFLLSKFTSWTRRNVDRLWIARDFDDLRSAMEPTPDRVRHIRLRHLVSESRTRLVRRAIRDGQLQWRAPPEIPEIQDWLSRAARGRAAFVSFTDECRDFIESQEGRPSEKLPHTKDAIRDYVRRYSAADLIVHPEGRGEYGDWRWRRHLECFPDRLLIARSARLELYYAIRRSLGDSRKFENNWDDKHYAIAASYTGHLATHDGGLMTAAEIIAPGLRICPRASSCSHSEHQIAALRIRRGPREREGDGRDRASLKRHPVRHSDPLKVDLRLGLLGHPPPHTHRQRHDPIDLLPA
jgi:hypothetical protein